MKEKLYTIPLNDAINAHDECPFCYIERNVEQSLLDFILGPGSSYMESDIREITDREGFCREHFQMMFDYGNTLGNGWILKTHYQYLLQEMRSEFKKYSPGKKAKGGFFQKDGAEPNALAAWAKKREKSCYICKRKKIDYERYMDTFFVMYKSDADFRARVGASKGFCLAHFGDLISYSESRLSDREKGEFLPVLFRLMEENMARLGEDVAWLVEKFDYRNKDADWRDSRDAIQRGMQKIKGGYPADPVYKSAK